MLVAGRGDEVLPLARVLEIGNGQLARFAEVQNRVVDLLHLRPQRRLHAGGIDDHGLDAGIGFGLAQVVEHRAQSRRPVAFEQLRDPFGGDFVQVVVEAQDQRRIARNRRRLPIAA